MNTKLNLHPITQKQLARISATRGLCYIFAGPKGIGKREAAHELGQDLVAGALEYIITVSAESEQKPAIKIDAIKDLHSGLVLAPLILGQNRVVIIEGADYLTIEASNALLKLLEEPPENTSIILTTESLFRILPTIRSRAQIVRFVPTDSKAEVDTKNYQLAKNFLIGQLNERFLIAKQINDDKTAEPDFVQSLYDVANAEKDYETLSLLIRLENLLAHNVNVRLSLEWLALELEQGS